MEETVIKEIKELNAQVKEIIRQHSESDQKVILGRDFVFDQAKHDFPQELINNALLEGLHLEDKHLYPSDPDEKHKGKNYYCIYRYKRYTFLVNYLLMSYLKKPEQIILFHISPLSFGSKGQRKYTEIMKTLKDPSFKDT